MATRLSCLALGLAGLGLSLVPLAAHAQTTGCQFVLGFQTLHDMDPTDVGGCQDNQGFAGNGDAQQHTSNGLLAWRKADNWTAFTNGYLTWINGPSGLVRRLNTQRFSWEANPDGLPLADSPGGAATPPAPAAPVSPSPSASAPPVPPPPASPNPTTPASAPPPATAPPTYGGY